MREPGLVLTDPAMLEHDPGPGHPERPARLRALIDSLAADPPVGWSIRPPRPASRAQLARVHTADYLDRLEALVGRSGWLDPDTAYGPRSLHVARLAAGAAVEATEAALAGQRGFALVRPPGHHAEPGGAAGFCLLNGIAVAAAHALAAPGVGRVLLVDWDLHHGNGTQHAFDADPRLLYVSTHQSPFYPGTGRFEETGIGAGAGTSVNVPLPAGTGEADYVWLYRQLLPPLAEAFAPDLLLVSAGFDIHSADPLGGMGVGTEGIGALCALLRDLADRHAGGRIALVLEGGYSPRALVEGVRRCLDVLVDRGPAPAPDEGPPSRVAREAFRRVVALHGHHWPLG
jgi:acetoin utilization deacetylase AcuC-like enzyme